MGTRGHRGHRVRLHRPRPAARLRKEAGQDAARAEEVHRRCLRGNPEERRGASERDPGPPQGSRCPPDRHQEGHRQQREGCHQELHRHRQDQQGRGRQEGCAKLNSFLMCPFNALGTAMLSYCGQNYGAAKTERIKKGVAQALLISFIEYIVFGGIGLLLTINGFYMQIFYSAEKINEMLFRGIHLLILLHLLRNRSMFFQIFQQ